MLLFPYYNVAYAGKAVNNAETVVVKGSAHQNKDHKKHEGLLSIIAKRLRHEDDSEEGLLSIIAKRLKVELILGPLAAVLAYGSGMLMFACGEFGCNNCVLSNISSYTLGASAITVLGCIISCLCKL